MAYKIEIDKKAEKDFFLEIGTIDNYFMIRAYALKSIGGRYINEQPLSTLH